MGEAGDKKLAENECNAEERASALFDEVIVKAGWLNVTEHSTEIMISPPAVQKHIAVLCAKDLMVYKTDVRANVSQTLLEKLLALKLPFDNDDLLALLKLGNRMHEIWQGIPLELIVAAALQVSKRTPLSKEVCTELETLASTLDHLGGRIYKAASKIAKKLARQQDPDKLVVEIFPQEAWSDLVISDIRTMNDTLKGQWLALLNHATSLTGAKPSNKWLTQANEQVSPIGGAELLHRLSRWLPLIGKRGTKDVTFAEYQPDPNELICAENADLLKGLIWCCASEKADEVARLLASTAEKCFKKVAWAGPRCPKVGNACIAVLSFMDTKASIAQMSRLNSVTKSPSSKKRIEKELSKAADRSGMSTEELQEISVPNFGFTEVGRYTERVGECTAEILIKGVNSTELVWKDKNGTTLTSVPAVIKKEHADRVKLLKNLTSDVQSMLPAIRHRIESSLLQQRHWDYTSWRERYLDHPISGAMTRRLIWQINGKAAIWSQGKMGERTWR